MPNNKSYQTCKTLVIGCGIKKIKGAWNVDILESVNPDEVVDISWGLPYEDNSFEEVIADYVLEQIHDNKIFINTLNEIWRVLKPSGVFRLKVPNAEFPEAFRDPMDCRYFTPNTFDHFNKAHYRWFAFQYGFMPWHKISIVPERINRLSVRMTPYKNKINKKHI